LRVMIVDDEPETLGMLSVALEQCNAVVKAAGSAVEALELMERWLPDIMISDIGMPGEDGYELIAKVRALDPERGGKLPAIALTAYARDDDRRHVLAAGFNTHVAKPVDPAELIIVIANLAKIAGKK
jgi:CheY-like chemotaxis protein